MRDPANVARQQQAGQQGLVIGLITLPFRFIGVLLGSLMLCLVIDLVGLHWFWPDQGWRHAQGMMNFELQQLSVQFTQSLLMQEPGRSANRLVGWLYQSLLLDSGFLDCLMRANDQARANGFNTVVAKTVTYTEHYLLAAFYTTATFLLRLFVLALTLPLFVLAALAGIVDGLVQRDLRRFSAGRESGFLYHRARATILPLVVFPWVAYLALPVSVHSMLILLPATSLQAIAIHAAVRSFKKHL